MEFFSTFIGHIYHSLINRQFFVAILINIHSTLDSATFPFLYRILFLYTLLQNSATHCFLSLTKEILSSPFLLVIIIFVLHSQVCRKVVVLVHSPSLFNIICSWALSKSIYVTWSSISNLCWWHISLNVAVKHLNSNLKNRSKNHLDKLSFLVAPEKCY